MSNIESVEDVFILMPIFKDSKKLAYYLGCIVNWGKRKGDKVEFSTNNGIVVKAISELNSDFVIRKESEFDLKDSLYQWLRINKWENQNKEFVIDNTIETGEIYTQYTWSVKVIEVEPKDLDKECEHILTTYESYLVPSVYKGEIFKDGVKI